jgi:pimeloyl-ACP methyl ester carboxylesterase
MPMKRRERCFVEIDGKRLETETIGNVLTDVPVLAILHAGLSCVDGWKNFPEKLVETTGMSALVYSRYGYGQSDPLRESRNSHYLHHEAEVVLPQVLARFGITRPVLFGHSDGATIALLYAAKFPQSPIAVIAEAPHVFVEDITIAGLLEAKKAFEEERSALKAGLNKYHIDAPGTFRGWNDIWLNPAFRSWNIVSELNTISCPILLIQGDEDQYGTIAQLEAIKSMAPQAEIAMIHECMHSPHQDQEGTVLKKADDFLRQLTGQAKGDSASS